MPPNHWTRAQKIVSESLNNPLTLSHHVIMLFPPKDACENVGDECADRSLCRMGDRGRSWDGGNYRSRNGRNTRSRDRHPGEGDGRLERHHPHEQPSTPQLAVHLPGLTYPRPDT